MNGDAALPVNAIRHVLDASKGPTQKRVKSIDRRRGFSFIRKTQSN